VAANSCNLSCSVAVGRSDEPTRTRWFTMSISSSPYSRIGFGERTLPYAIWRRPGLLRAPSGLRARFVGSKRSSEGDADRGGVVRLAFSAWRTRFYLVGSGIRPGGESSYHVRAHSTMPTLRNTQEVNGSWPVVDRHGRPDPGRPSEPERDFPVEPARTRFVNCPFDAGLNGQCPSLSESARDLVDNFPASPLAVNRTFSTSALGLATGWAELMGGTLNQRLPRPHSMNPESRE